MSLTSHLEIERVGRVGRECQHEDASDLPATSRACRARGIWRTTRHTDKRAALYTAADRRPTNQVSAWKLNGEIAGHARHPRNFLTSGVSARMSRGCYEETAPVEFKLNYLTHHILALDALVFCHAEPSLRVHCMTSHIT